MAHYEEDLGKLVRYARRILAAMALGASSYWKAFCYDWQHAEKKRTEDNIRDLKIQRNRYTRETKEAFASLSRVKNDLIPLNFLSPVSDQVAQLVMTMDMKY